MKLTPAEQELLLKTLHNRFHKNPERHAGISWHNVEARLMAHPEKCRSLQQMEASDGEPDVVMEKDGAFVFYDCSAESPAGRRSLCFDPEALDARKEYKPVGSAVGMAAEMGIKLLDEEQYRYLQSIGKFDQKTSSWLATPEPVRKLGGALFGDYRFGRVFVYHNGVQSYYAARGFRGVLMV